MLDEAERQKLRSLVAMLNYMIFHKSQHAAKEMCTKMANPSRGSWKGLTPAGFLKGVEKVTRAVRTWEHDELKGGRARGFGLGERVREEVDMRN